MPYLRVKCPEPHHLLWTCREGPFSLVRIPLSYSLTHSPLHPHFAYSVDMCCVSTHVQSLLEPGEVVLKAQRLMAPGQVKGTDLTQERPTFRPDFPILLFEVSSFPGPCSGCPRSQRPSRHPLICTLPAWPPLHRAACSLPVCSKSPDWMEHGGPSRAKGLVLWRKAGPAENAS